MLVSYPAPEYSLLHNGTFLEGKPLGTIAAGSSVALPYPGTSGATSDAVLSFDPSGCVDLPFVVALLAIFAAAAAARYYLKRGFLLWT